MHEKRVQWLDVARGIGMILVILGHSVTTVIRNDSAVAMGIFNGIYYFHMPLLLYLSGFAYRISSNRYETITPLPFLRKKAATYMAPYVCYGLLVYLSFVFANSIPSVAKILSGTEYELIPFSEWFYGMLAGANLYSIHLWYIYTLFLLTVITFWSSRFIKNYQRILLIAGIAFFLFFNIRLGIAIGTRVIKNLIWFSLGLNFNFSRLKLNVARVAGLFCIAAILLFSRHLLNSSAKSAMVLILKNLVNCITITIIIILTVQIATKITGRWKDALASIGSNSYGIYMFHQPYFGSGIGMVLYGYFKLPVIFVVFLSVIMSVTVPTIIVKILSMPKLKLFKQLLLGGK